MEQCLTFLPLRSVPLPYVSHREIAIGFVNQNHFVEVFLVPGHPTPPIATNWQRYHHPCAQGPTTDPCAIDVLLHDHDDLTTLELKVGEHWQELQLGMPGCLMVTVGNVLQVVLATW
ncbi:hypothetical protein AAC387_Pa02g5046 [Persea americana]